MAIAAVQLVLQILGVVAIHQQLPHPPFQIGKVKRGAFQLLVARQQRRAATQPRRIELLNFLCGELFIHRQQRRDQRLASSHKRLRILPFIGFKRTRFALLRET